MRLLEFVAENFKKVRVVGIVPKHRVVQITGRNGQGKTSVLDALWVLFAGKKAIPEKPVRRGADRAKLKATIGDDDGKPILIARRIVQQDRTTQLTIEAAPGAERAAGTPQAILDQLTGVMSFDPVAFIHMDSKQQVEILRATVKLDVDLDALTLANAEDYDKRHGINQRTEQLTADIAAIQLSVPDLPAEKLDEAAIHTALDNANNKNQAVHLQTHIKAQADAALARVDQSIATAEEKVRDAERLIEEAEERLARSKTMRDEMVTALAELKQTREEQAKKVKKLPAGELVDVTALLKQLTTAQTINAEIDLRARQMKLAQTRLELQRESETITRRMEQREERKREAFVNAKFAVPGLTFNEEGVLWNGLPLENAGEAEQIRISVALAMASKPKLRMIPIRHGEALDDHSLALIEQLAEENDFHVFMTRVDSSGKVGVVIVDGEVESDNQ